MKISLSAIIITFNEEKNIGRCLESVKSVAEDIVVVDSYSTDKTEEICLKNGVRFIQHEFEGYTQQKNYAVTQARYPHILSLDADEVLSDLLKGSILKVKENWDADGYKFNRLNNYCGKWIYHSGWYPDRKLRLWDSRKGKWKGRNLHEWVEMEQGTLTGHLKGNLFHYSYYSINQHVNQINIYSDISARAKYEKGKKISTLFTLFRMLTVFLKKYFFQLGLLDGYSGLVISIMSAYSVFLKDIKLKELNKKS